MTRSLFALAARVLARCRPARCRPVRKSARPRVEALEDRSVPAVITVTNPSDSGEGSLRWAVGEANRLAGDDTIEFAAPQSILLTSGQLSLTDTTGKTTIEGLGADRVAIFDNSHNRLFLVGAGVTAEISGLTLTGGRALFNGSDYSTGCGGAIYNAGVLTVSGSTLSGNFAYHEGGGLYNAAGASLTVTGSILYGNSSANFSGGIENRGTLTVSGSTLSRNTAARYGGGISNAAGVLTVSASIFSFNTSAQIGGGIYNSGVLTVSASTFSENSALYGGGIYTGHGSLTVSQSSFFGNSASDYGGGIANVDGGLTVSQCTLTDNSAQDAGGGIASYGNLSATLHNTLVAGNHLTAGGPSDLDGTFAPGSSYNLIGDGSGGLSSDPGWGNLLGTPDNLLNPLLGLLADNGGPTQTMALLPGSPAIDAGDTELTTDLYDQRGPGFARVVGDHIDIGAFEVQAVTAQGQLEALADHVRALVREDALRTGVGRSLTARLDAAAASLDRGNTTATVHQLESFIKQVQGLWKAGKLTDEVAQHLTVAAGRAIDLAALPADPLPNSARDAVFAELAVEPTGRNPQARMAR